MHQPLDHPAGTTFPSNDGPQGRSHRTARRWAGLAERPRPDHPHRRRVGRAAVLSAALVALPLLSSCGDDDGRLSQAEFLERGNAVCEASNGRIQATATQVMGTSSGPPTVDQFTAIFKVASPEVRGQIDALDALVPPEEMAGDVDRLIDSANRAYAAMVKAIETDPMAFAEAESDPFEETNALAVKLGLTACAEE